VTCLFKLSPLGHEYKSNLLTLQFCTDLDVNNAVFYGVETCRKFSCTSESSVTDHLKCVLQLCKQDQLLLHQGLLMQNLARQRSLSLCKCIILQTTCCSYVLCFGYQMQKLVCRLLQFSIHQCSLLGLQV
jgi:hypothetical protein